MGELQTFGQWLRHHRRDLDLTQVELSQRVGCAPVTIRKVEADEMRPSKQLAELLVEQLGVPVEERENFIRFARGGELVEPVVAAERRHNLPNPVSSFIGREREIQDIQGLLDRSRLVTMTGVGGSGKTRLALEVACNLVDTYQNGVWWVELAMLTANSLVPQTIAKTFSLQETPNQQTSEILENYLRNKRILLVIDNCEHLIDGCAKLGEKLLQACLHLGILATSREPLGIAGETVYQVSPLSLPDPDETSPKKLLQSEAARMFVERARAISPDFSLGEQNMTAVVQICRCLDGIPLALELAAARVRHLTVEHIAERLDKRFDLLTTGSRTALPRQQTLRAAMDWSFDLLSKKEKILFRRLSAFAGGFTLDTAVRVCAGQQLGADDVLPELSRLVDRSLVEVVQNGGLERYRMLDTIRAYAAGRLHESGEEDRLRDRHLEHFTMWTEEVEPRLRGPEQITWWDQMEIEHNNIRSALEWSLTGGDVKMGLRLAGAAFWFWKKRNYWREGLQWLKDTLARAPIQGRTSDRAKVLVLASYMALDYHTGDPISAWCEEGLGIFRELGDKWWISFSLMCIGWRRILMNQATSARDSFEESVSFAREDQDDWILSFALRGLGAAMERVDYELARPLLEESILHAQVAGDQWALSEGLKQLGTVALGQGDYDRVESLGKESLSLVQGIGDKQLISESLMFLGRAGLGLGDTKRAQKFLEEALPFAESVGYMEGVVEILICLGYVAEVEGHPWRSAILLAASESFLNSISATIKSRPWDLRDYDFYLSKVKEQLGEVEFDRAMTEGRAMSLEQTIRYAMEVRKKA
jgi:non-specific serine/threonine protein kinase